MKHEDTRVQRFTRLIVAGVLILLAIGVFVAGGKKQSKVQRFRFAATIHPLAAILRELAGDRVEIVQLLVPGASPHTYEPRPSDLRTTENAMALFYIHHNLDGWAAKLPTKECVGVFDFLPADLRLPIAFEDADESNDSHIESGKDHGDSLDSHFWTDPLMVKAIVPQLTETLSRLDPQGSGVYHANSERFVRDLDALDTQLQETLASVKSRPVFLFHPSLQYLLKRYGLVFAGCIEPFPGKEPSPKYLQGIVDRLKAAHAKAIFTEPQLSPRPAQAVAEAAGVKLFELDPNGGVPGRESYSELLLYNARILREALE